MKHFTLLFSGMILFFLAACSQPSDADSVASGTSNIVELAPTAESDDTAPAAAAEATPVTGATAEPTLEATGSTAPSPATPAAIIPPTALPIEPSLEPIEVTYFTPAQGEGPYYTIDKPEDRDNDLTVLLGADGTPAGEVMEFSGIVYDNIGRPIPGVVIEIWQTDESGVYLHPGDPSTDKRDRNFQFYGEAITATDGSYEFRTILPGRYEPRPRHIHVKIKFEGNELLTTQFYFAGDAELAGEALFSQAGQDGEHLLVSLTEGLDAAGKPIFVGQRDIILNVDLSG